MKIRESSSSRLRTDNPTLFDVCCEVYQNDSLRSVKVLYPLEYSNQALLNSIGQFCFPFGHSRCDQDGAIQLFTFVLTDSQSLYTFAYCRFSPKNNTCLCLLSGYFYVNLFYKFLNHVSNLATKGTVSDLQSFLNNAYLIDVPEPGGTLNLNACTPIGRFSDTIPDINKLTTLREDRFMLEFYSAITERQMIHVFASVLKERRIIFTSSKLSQMSSCAFAAAQLLFPFHWQNMFIPVLPYELVDMLTAPMPYIIGVTKSVFMKVKRSDIGGAVIIDLDEKQLESPYDDALPSEALNFLRHRLKLSAGMFLSDSFTRSFLQTNVLIFGGYSHGFVTDESGKFVWDRNNFIEKQRPSMQAYLSLLVERDSVQYFERFIDERLDALNRGVQIDDEFDKEIKNIETYRLGKTAYKPPEVFQNAFSNIKENASDVFETLKGQIQSITLNDRLLSLGIKNENAASFQQIRSSTRKSKRRIDPLFIDAKHYLNEGPAENNTLKPDVTGDSISDAESVKSVQDLIDFSDDHLWASPSMSSGMMSSSAKSSPNLRQLGQTKQLNFDPFISIFDAALKTDSHSSPKKEDPNSSSMPTDIAKKRSQWETFG